MSTAVRHAYGYTLISVAAGLYVWDLLLIRALRQRVAERYPELAKEITRTRWRRWKVNLPPGDPAVRNVLRASHALHIASTACLFGGFALADITWWF